MRGRSDDGSGSVVLLGCRIRILFSLGVGLYNLSFDTIQLFEELFSQPKLDIYGVSKVKSKSVDTPISKENWLYITMQKKSNYCFHKWI